VYRCSAQISPGTDGKAIASVIAPEYLEVVRQRAMSTFKEGLAQQGQDIRIATGLG
jgi:hypothetical protein